MNCVSSHVVGTSFMKRMAASGASVRLFGVNAGPETVELTLDLPMLARGTTVEVYEDEPKTGCLRSATRTVKKPGAVRVSIRPNSGVVMTADVSE